VVFDETPLASASIAWFGFALRYCFDMGELPTSSTPPSRPPANGLRTADIKSEGAAAASTTQMGDAILTECRRCARERDLTQASSGHRDGTDDRKRL
jgi:hypothetical protein